MLEVEVKVKTKLDKAEILLQNLNFTKGTTVYEKDTYYNSKQLDLKEADKALRIREHRDIDLKDTIFILNFKGPKIDTTTMTREESEFEVPNFETCEKMLNGLGFFATGNVEKTRIHYKKDNVTCCLDSVTNLGEFLEIEIMAEESEYDVAISKIKDLLGKLGLGMSDTIRKSYLSMLEF